MLLLVAVGGALGAIFTLREWGWLFAAGIWAWMLLMPAVEAAEQTVVQRVVPFAQQGRVFGVAMMFEMGAAPITAFLVAPLAEFLVIPYLQSDAGAETWHWLLGEGEARGIGLMFVIAGLASIVIAFLASPQPHLPPAHPQLRRVRAGSRAGRGVTS